MAWQITGHKQLDRTLGTWKELHKELETSNLNNNIISSESFGAANKKQIEILGLELKPYKVKIIVYFRRQDIQLESKYVQKIKKGKSDTTDIISFVESQKEYFDYYQRIKPWSEVFGVSNIIVRPLEKTQIPNLCQDILNIFGLPDFKNFSEVDNQNIKPGRKSLEVQKLVNDIYKNYPKNEKKNYLKKIRKYLEKNWSEESRYRLLPYSYAVKILDQFKESNKEVAQKYLGRKDGILFYEQIEKYEHSDITIEDFSREELVVLIQALKFCSL